MKITTAPATWTIETKDGNFEHRGIVVHGSFVDKEHALDLDERDNLEALIEMPDMPKAPESLRARRMLDRERKIEEKAAQQRAYMKRQVQVTDAINAHITAALDANPAIDLSQFGEPQHVELNKNRKSRKVSFIRRYPVK